MMMKQLLITSILCACSAGVFACHHVTKAVSTNSVTQLVKANQDIYVQHVGGALIKASNASHQLWILSK